MEFEFDQAKSSANKEKHGIDFDEALSLSGMTLICWKLRPFHRMNAGIW